MKTCPKCKKQITKCAECRCELLTTNVQSPKSSIDPATRLVFIIDKYILLRAVYLQTVNANPEWMTTAYKKLFLSIYFQIVDAVDSLKADVKELGVVANEWDAFQVSDDEKIVLREMRTLVSHVPDNIKAFERRSKILATKVKWTNSMEKQMSALTKILYNYAIQVPSLRSLISPIEAEMKREAESSVGPKV